MTTRIAPLLLLVVSAGALEIVPDTGARPGLFQVLEPPAVAKVDAKRAAVPGHVALLVGYANDGLASSQHHLVYYFCGYDGNVALFRLTKDEGDQRTGLDIRVPITPAGEVLLVPPSAPIGFGVIFKASTESGTLTFVEPVTLRP